MGVGRVQLRLLRENFPCAGRVTQASSGRRATQAHDAGAKAEPRIFLRPVLGGQQGIFVHLRAEQIIQKDVPVELIVVVPESDGLSQKQLGRHAGTRRRRADRNRRRR